MATKTSSSMYSVQCKVDSIQKSAAPTCSTPKVAKQKNWTLKGASLNARTLKDELKLVNLAIQCEKFGNDFICLQETKRSGMQTSQLPGRFSRWKFINSGFSKKSNAGVGILFSPRSQVDETVEVVPGRILSCRVAISGLCFQIISCYAPDESYSEDSKSHFWGALDKHLSGLQRRKLRITVGGDFNATIVEEYETQVASPWLGRENSRSCHERSAKTSYNGHQLLRLATGQRLYIANTKFLTKKSCHRYTFESNLKYTRRLDYILLDKYTFAHTKHCRSFTPPISSDHRMVLFRANMPTRWMRKSQTKKLKCREKVPNVRLLGSDSDTRKKYADKLEECCEGVGTSDDPNELCEEIIRKIADATSATIPEKSKSNHIFEWVTPEYEQLHAKIRVARDPAQRKALLRERDRLSRKLKNEFYIKRAAELNAHHEARKAEGFFRRAKELEGPLNPAKAEIKCTETKFVDHFTTHFRDRELPIPQELQNTELPSLLPLSSPISLDELPKIDESPPTASELEATIKRLRNGRCRNDDGVFNEQIKYGSTAKSFIDLLLKLILILWNAASTLPATWRNCTINAIYKKFDPFLAKNYRPISIIPGVGKILTKLGVQRMRARYHALLGKCQFGFRSNSGCTDAIWCFNRVKMKTKCGYALFLDLRGAFDLVDRRVLMKILERQLKAPKLVGIFEEYYKDTWAKMKNGDISFPIFSGVRQGCEESPLLFCLFFDFVLSVIDRRIHEKFKNPGLKIKFNIRSEASPRHLRSTGPLAGYTHLLKMLYADDLIVLEDDYARLQSYMETILEVFEEYGLIIAVDKTKLLVWGDDTKYDFRIGDEPIEQVDHFRYLGHNIHTHNRDYFLNVQIGAAYSAYNKHKHVLQDQRVSLRARMILLTCLVRSRLIYAVQSWQLSEVQIQRLSVVWNRMVRNMVRGGYARKNPDDESDHALKISNEKLFEIAGVPTMREFIKRQQLQYASHVTRMRNDSWQKITMFITNERGSGGDSLRRYANDLGGIDIGQMLRLMQQQKEICQELEMRFGNASKGSAKNR